MTSETKDSQTSDSETGDSNNSSTESGEEIQEVKDYNKNYIPMFDPTLTP